MIYIINSVNSKITLKGTMLLPFCNSFQVYTPSQILNQSHVIMMFKSGAGVEVIENKHYMAARVFLPWEFVVSIS